MRTISKVMTTVFGITLGLGVAAPAANAQVTSLPSVNELRAVIDSVQGIGNGLGNSSARPVGKDTDLVLTLKGKLYQQDKSGKVTEVGDVKQLSIGLPAKVGDRTNAQDICLRRAEALQAGHTRAKLEIFMEALRVGEQHYKVKTLFGCSDLTVALATPTPKPRATPTPKPRATPTPKPRATPTPITFR